LLDLEDSTANRLKKSTKYTLFVSQVPTPMNVDNPFGSVVITTGFQATGSTARSHA